LNKPSLEVRGTSRAQNDVGDAVFRLSPATRISAAIASLMISALFAAFAFLVVREVAAAAARRAEGGGFTAALIALAALALAGLALLLPPLGLVALAALAWLYLRRRRRAGRKYEGLRTLR